VSTAKVDKLVRMANQIGDFFGPMGEDAAARGVATHLKRFWTPKMIGELVEHADSDHNGLNAATARAVEELKKEYAGQAGSRSGSLA
jgi:formate dehydrogenase subunit delta